MIFSFHLWILPLGMKSQFMEMIARETYALSKRA